MTATTTERHRIDAFLASRRIALVGASTRPDAFSRQVMRDLVARGVDVVPVNPAADEIEGRRAFARVQDVSPPVEAALVMTSADRSADVVTDCADAGVRLVWLHRGAGPGAVSDEALARAEERGLELIGGRCPLMFLGEPGLTHPVHRFHRGFERLVHHYPEPAERPSVAGARRWGVALGWAVAAWALCAGALAVGWMTLSGDGALVARAVAAPVVSFGLGFAYERIVGRFEPWALATIFVLTVSALDAAVIAGLVLGSFAALANPAATWLPALTVFAAVWIGGRLALGPAPPRQRHGHAAA